VEEIQELIYLQHTWM